MIWKNSAFIIMLVILGYLISQQLELNSRVKIVTDPSTTSALSVEVAELIKGNKKLDIDLTTLQQQESTLSQSSSSNSQTDTSLNDQLKQLKILAGTTSVTGQGVQITFEQSIQLTQLVDLVNALRNIGAEAISINDKRVVMNTALTENMGNTPLAISAIGNKDVLHDALLRRGGIMEQTGSNGQVDAKDTITIPAVK